MLPGHLETFSEPGFRAGRQCLIYLPPGYATSGDRYPVLYATDGEWVFDGNGAMHVNGICEDLIREGEIRPIIIVAIENVPGLREWELTPWGDGYYYGGGQQFLQAIRDTLKPTIDRRYRTLPDAANTAITGASLGGVFAAYAGIAHSETFGNVAAFSPSYWLDDRYIVPFADSVSRVRSIPLAIRHFYQDTGTDGDNDIGDMEKHLSSYGFQLGINFMSLTVADGKHGWGAWAHRYPQMLEFLFPPK
jgi:enterochelin esterase-like enzyme